MRIGYLFRGFLGDVKMDVNGNELSTPDGNATYSWSIEHECNRRRYKLIPLGPNLDAPAAERMGPDLFAAFSQRQRVSSYERMLRNGWTRLSDRKFPELDLLLVEWRWPIPGRNTPDDRGKPGFQPDLDRQEEVLRHYSDLGVPIVVWDLDHKLTADDERRWSMVGGGGGPSIIETSVKPIRQLYERTRVEPPILIDHLLQHKMVDRMPIYHIGYIGSRYERDESIDEWILPITPPNTHRAKFWGKWEPRGEVEARWPGITFAGRIGVNGFYDAYSKVACVPLLAKRSYYETGFITPRPWEAILFGTIPVGLKGHLGIEQYTEFVAQDAHDLLNIAREIRTMSHVRREILREDAAHMLSHMDVRNFVDTLERLAEKTPRTESKENG
jgi:hypothetical protein